VGTFVLGPIYFHRAQLNGAPFQPGDVVEILVGPNRGRVVRVLESWDWRGMVKVDLGAPATSKRRGIFRCRYIFEETQLLKVADGEPHLAADALTTARR
jgi:transcription elongation factor